MSKHVTTTIRYDGPALASHEMDVQDLAPALLALAEIAKIANHKFNGDKASIRILVNADTEQKCFQLDLSLVQSWMDHAALFVGKDNVATARQIAEMIGLAGPPLGGLFWLYKKIYGQKPAEGASPAVTFTADDATGTTVININGDGNSITVSNQTAVLAQDPKVLQHVKTVLEPLGNPDYEDFSIIQGDEALVQIDRDEAQNIRSMAQPLPSEEAEAENFISTVDGQVEIVTAQFKGAAQWGLWWTGRTRQMKIEDEHWLSRFQTGGEPEAVPGAWLDVTMEITQPRDKAHPPTFVVKRVKGVLPPSADQQTDMFD
ncbi:MULTISPECIES: hypothetical protein [unclassified Sphingopyxis]|uniref:hypothetical protein n=1 Tax=unclassified Sphingopyxis TaxID=2614943 RepID=UPI002864EF65|nr:MULTISPECIES: hypothetical protein [unclassified Sphingopyxis]MDR6834667.1 hypothetical protein [Sphingopyxis sp. BE122]MDR7226937.1 hypothetical protein [Sphingopyxis sp. BE259]